MSSTLSEGIMLIAVVIAAVTLSQSFLQSMNFIQTKASETSSYIGDKISTDVKIINVYLVNQTSVRMWIKNIGDSILYPTNIADSDVFFGNKNGIVRLNYNMTGTGWNYAILGEDTSRWRQGETIEILITLGAPSVGEDEYYVSFVTYNGVKTNLYFN
jgi:archaellum component FlaG (FlaF/FlaG flagellin family)